ncbi:Detected protein of unknown function [Hibiscus syriacus]|uniref:Uncharacterized protein n=1 Tax=Hibiscus syriacus TaxID=106335 RepID=A0A6A2YAQ3_HIBSY|nr:Detected protein of unknown function [Hibiscus syriacus]
MSRLKALLSHQTKCLLKTQNPPSKILHPSPSFTIRRTLNSSSQKQTKTPLSVLFQEAAGGAEAQREAKNNGMKREVRNLKANPKGKRKENQGLDWERTQKVKTVKVRRERGEVRALKDLSQLAEIFIRHLFAKGYFNKASFLEHNKLDFSFFGNSYGRDFIKFAAYEFVESGAIWVIGMISNIDSSKELWFLLSMATRSIDHNRWLPVNHLKNVVLFGCPSLDKYNVFAAKRLRKFFKIQENTVCSRCVLKESCEYANNIIWGIGTNSLLLVDVMKVITLYALDLLPAKLAVPDEVKDSINQLLKVYIRYGYVYFPFQFFDVFRGSYLHMLDEYSRGNELEGSE